VANPILLLSKKRACAGMSEANGSGAGEQQLTWACKLTLHGGTCVREKFFVLNRDSPDEHDERRDKCRDMPWHVPTGVKNVLNRDSLD